MIVCSGVISHEPNFVLLLFSSSLLSCCVHIGCVAPASPTCVHGLLMNMITGFSLTPVKEQEGAGEKVKKRVYGKETATHLLFFYELLLFLWVSMSAHLLFCYSKCLPCFCPQSSVFKVFFSVTPSCLLRSFYIFCNPVFSHSHTEIDNHPQSALHFLVNPSFESVLMSCHFPVESHCCCCWTHVPWSTPFLLTKACWFEGHVAFSAIEMQGMVIMWRLLCWR